MAKKKSNAVIEEPIEEIVEETIDTEEPMEPIHEEPIEVIEVETDNQEQFINMQLRMINKLNNPAKAKRLADRVLRNRKR